MNSCRLVTICGAFASTVLVLDRGRVVRQEAPLGLLTEASGVAAPEHDLENFLPGHVRAHDEGGGVTRVALEGGGEMTVPLAAAHAPGGAVMLVVRAEDVLVAMEPPHHLSARNLFPARVSACMRAGSDVTLHCTLASGGTGMMVRLTPSAVDALGIREGGRVWLAIKSHSIRTT